MAYDFSQMSDAELDSVIASAGSAAGQQDAPKPFDVSSMSDDELDAVIASADRGNSAAPAWGSEESIAQKRRAIERAQQPGENESVGHVVGQSLLEGAKGGGRVLKAIGEGIVGMGSGALRLAGTQARLLTGWEGLHKLADSIDQSYANFGADALMSDYGEDPDGWGFALGRFGEKLAGTAGSLLALGGVSKGVGLAGNALKAAGHTKTAAAVSNLLPAMFGNDAAVRAYDTARANEKSKAESAALAALNGAIHFFGFKAFENKALNKMLGMPAEMDAMLPTWATQAMEARAPKGFADLVRGMRNGMVKYTLAERGKGALRAGGIMAVQDMLSDVPMQVAEGGSWDDIDFNRVGKKGLHGLAEGGIMEGSLAGAAILRSNASARKFVADKFYRGEDYKVVGPDGREHTEPGLLNTPQGRMLLMKQNPAATERVLDIVEHGGKPRAEELDAAFLPPDMNETELRRFAADWREDLRPYVDEAWDADQPTRMAAPAESAANPPRREFLSPEEAEGQQRAMNDAAERGRVESRVAERDQARADEQRAANDEQERVNAEMLAREERRAREGQEAYDQAMLEREEARARAGEKPKETPDEARADEAQPVAAVPEVASVPEGAAEVPRPVEAEPPRAEAPRAGVVEPAAEPKPTEKETEPAQEPQERTAAPETANATPAPEKSVETPPAASDVKGTIETKPETEYNTQTNERPTNNGQPTPEPAVEQPVNDFQRVQAESRGMPDEDRRAYRSGSRELGERELGVPSGGRSSDRSGTLVGALRGRVASANGGRGLDGGVDVSVEAKKKRPAETFKIGRVDGQTFRDVFEVARSYLKNGELVDLHDSYGDDVKCYLSDDGLSGFAVEPDGNLVSVFSLRPGSLKAMAPEILKAGATHLDAYNSNRQQLLKIYEHVLGFKPSSEMDYSMAYDHDDIAANHGRPKVVFMVLPKKGQKVESRHFTQDQYDDAVSHQKKQLAWTNKLKRADGTDPLAEREASSSSAVTPEPAPEPEAKPGAMSPTQKRNRLAKVQGILSRIDPDIAIDTKALRYGQNNPNGLKLGDLKMLDDPANDGWQYELGLPKERADELRKAVHDAYEEQRMASPNRKDKANETGQDTYSVSASQALERLAAKPNDFKRLGIAHEQVSAAIEAAKRQGDEQGAKFWEDRLSALNGQIEKLAPNEQSKVVQYISDAQSKKSAMERKNTQSLETGEGKTLDVAVSEEDVAQTNSTRGGGGTGGSLAGNRHLRIDKIDGDKLTVTAMDAAGKPLGPARQMKRAEWKILGEAAKINDNIDGDPSNPQKGDMLRMSKGEAGTHDYANDADYQKYLKDHGWNDAPPIRERYEREGAKLAAERGNNLLRGVDIKVESLDREYDPKLDGGKEIKDPDSGRVVGTYNRETNEVKLFRGATVKTLVHELGGHATLRFAEQEAERGNRSLLDRINKAIDEAPQELKDEIRKRYPKAGDAELRDEVWAALRERNSPAMEKAIKTLQGKAWYNRAWAAFKDAWKGLLSRMGFNRADLSKINRMDHDEFLDFLDKTMAEGKTLGRLEPGKGEGTRNAKSVNNNERTQLFLDGKHVFHCAEDADVESIVKNGLRIGSNVSYDDNGQAFGQETGVILVFDKSNAAVSHKGYQDDGITGRAAKPIAALIDENAVKLHSADYYNKKAWSAWDKAYNLMERIGEDVNAYMERNPDLFYGKKREVKEARRKKGVLENPLMKEFFDASDEWEEYMDLAEQTPSSRKEIDVEEILRKNGVPIVKVNQSWDEDLDKTVVRLAEPKNATASNPPAGSQGGVRESRAPKPAGYKIMDDQQSKGEKFKEKFIDRYASVESVQDEIGGVKEIVGADGYTDHRKSTDYVAAADKANGRVEYEMRDLQHRSASVDKTLSEAALKGQSTADLFADFDLYLQCEHAPERNRTIAERNGVTYDADYYYGMGKVPLPGGNSVGLSENVANRLLRGLKGKYGSLDKFEEAAQKVYEINRADIQRRVEAGRLTPQEANQYLYRWQKYVPLKTDMERLEPEGFNSSTASMRRNEFMKAQGRANADIADSPLAASILQAEQGIRGAIRNELANVGANLVEHAAAQGKPIGEIVRGETLPKGAGWTFTLSDGTRVTAGGSMKLAENRPDVHLFKRDGELMAYRIDKGANGRGLAFSRAMSGENMGKWGSGMEWVPKMTAWMSAMRTQYSPEFTVSNLLADHLEAYQALVGRYGIKGGTAAFGKMVASEIQNGKDLYRYLKTGMMSRDVGEAVRAGLLTKGGVASEGFEGKEQSIRSRIEDIRRKQKEWRDMSAAEWAKSGWKNVTYFISMANELAEYSTRMGIFSALKKQGVPVKDAVKFARDATVNFNRKGTAMPLINGLYMFANASVQGAMRSVQAMRDEHGKELVGLLVGVGVAKAVIDHYLGNDDERDKKGGRNARNLSEYDRKHNVGVPVGGGYQFVPFRFRGPYAAIPYLAQAAANVALGERTPKAGALSLVRELGDQVTDIVGGNGVMNDKGEFDGSLAMQSIAPSVVDPFVQLASGKDYKGDDRKARTFDKTTPASSNGRRSTSKIYKGMAKGLNWLSGGNEFRKGFVDVAPEDLQLVLEFLGGGPMRDAHNTVATFHNVAQHVAGGTPERTLSQVPFVRRVVKEYPENTSRYYDALDGYERDKAEFKKTTDLKRRAEFGREHPYVRPMPDSTKSRVDVLAERVKELTHLERGEVKAGQKWVERKTPLAESQKETFRKRRLELQAKVLDLLGG